MTNVTGVRLDWGEYRESIPLAVQTRIEAGVERIRSVRDAIADDARVRLMPPVTIDPAVWTSGGGGIVHAASGAWGTGIGRIQWIGVIVGAGAALCADETVVRKLLVHEFAHCFEIATRIVDHEDLGTKLDLTGDPTDAAREHVMLGNPSDWFGDHDLPIIRWNDPLLEALDVGLQALLDDRHIPFTETPLVRPGDVRVPHEWVAHIRSLRQAPTN